MVFVVLPDTYYKFSDGEVEKWSDGYMEICDDYIMFDAEMSVQWWRCNYYIMSEHRRPAWWIISTCSYFLFLECVIKKNHYVMITFLISTPL